MVVAEIFVGIALYKQQAFIRQNGLPSFQGFGGALTIDGFALFFNWILVVATAIVAIVSYKYLEISGEHHTEYYGLLLFAQCGMFFLVTGTDLDHAVHRPGTDGALLLHHGGLPAHREALQRSRHQVPAAGRVFQRIPGLRIFA